MEPRNRFRQHMLWRAGTTIRVSVPAPQAGNRFLSTLKGIQIRAGCSTAGVFLPSCNYLVFGRFLLLRCSAASILPFLKPQNCASFHLVVFPSLLMFVVRQKLCLLQLSIIQSRSMGRNCLLRMSDFH
jgi:hypothetical protein